MNECKSGRSGAGEQEHNDAEAADEGDLPDSETTQCLPLLELESELWPDDEVVPGADEDPGIDPYNSRDADRGND